MKKKVTIQYARNTKKKTAQKKDNNGHIEVCLHTT